MNKDQIIFVFGSNLAGRHGAGAAKHAHKHFGAVYRVGKGPTGRAYAIPTKDEQLNVLPFPQIRRHVKDFIKYAKKHPELTFFVTRVGCGLAGFMEREMRPLFDRAPANCEFNWLDEDIRKRAK